MKILVVSSFLPYPLFSGGHVRLYNLLKQLSKHHEITLVCEKRSHQAQADIEAVKKFCKEIYVVNRRKQWSPEVIFQTAISPKPFLLAGHELPEMKKILSQLLQENKFDVIHIETFYVFQNLPETNIPTVLVEHNIEYKVYDRFADAAPFFVKPLLRIDVEKIKYFEKQSWEKATKVVAVSRVEAETMRKDAVVVANGVDLQDFPFKKSTTNANKTILFMGDFKWIQNRNTIQWILKDIWPILKKKMPSLSLWVVGKNMSVGLKEQNFPSVVFDEHAPDKTSDIYKKADLLLSPIKVGGGTSYKILEAMASGVPVVTTHLGIEGLGAENKKQALIGETSQELAEHALSLLRNEKEYARIARNARLLIEENYSWEKIGKILEGVYQDAVKK